jgi:hypothetical protein
MIVQSFSIKKRRATANAVALLLVRMMGLYKFQVKLLKPEGKRSLRGKPSGFPPSFK